MTYEECGARLFVSDSFLFQGCVIVSLSSIQPIPEEQLFVSFLPQPNYCHSIANFVFIPHIHPELLLLS